MTSSGHAREKAFAFDKADNSSAANMAMTTSNSMSVNPVARAKRSRRKLFLAFNGGLVTKN
jgi:hypothetical protein